MSEWLQDELKRQLRPVTAPDTLWQNVCVGAKPRQPLIRSFWAVPLFASFLFLLTAGLLWGIRQSYGHLSETTQFTGPDLELVSQSPGVDRCPSNDPSGIRKWLKAHGHLDVELPSGHAGIVRILGGRLVRLRGALIAAVDYQVGPNSAMLLVSRRACEGFFPTCNAGDRSEHQIVKTASAGGRSLLSWNMRDQSYMIAWTGTSDPQSGCLLCHVETPGRL